MLTALVWPKESEKLCLFAQDLFFLHHIFIEKPFAMPNRRTASRQMWKLIFLFFSCEIFLLLSLLRSHLVDCGIALNCFPTLNERWNYKFLLLLLLQFSFSVVLPSTLMDANQTQVYACHKTLNRIKTVDFEFILNVMLHKIDIYILMLSNHEFLFTFPPEVGVYFVLAEIKTC